MYFEASRSCCQFGQAADAEQAELWDDSASAEKTEDEADEAIDLVEAEEGLSE